jgi:hypothetical protein
MIKRYLLYLFRWQCSTPILAPIIAVFSHSPIWGTRESWIGAIVANLVGGLIFFWIDRFIFTSNKIDTVWDVREEVVCSDCGKSARGYRLVKTKGYDRTKAPPEFRCEVCSAKKAKKLKAQGVPL